MDYSSPRNVCASFVGDGVSRFADGVTLPYRYGYSLVGYSICVCY